MPDGRVTGVRAVAFDFGNVLSRPQDAAVRQRLHALTGLTPEQFAERYARYRRAYDVSLTSAEYWAQVVGDGRIAPGSALLAELVEADIQSWMTLDEEMVAWARTLKASGRSIAVLSNLPADLLVGLRRTHASLLSMFDAAVFSCEAGAAKPDPAIYRRLVDALGVDASTVLFIDDKLQNVEAAISAGLQAIRYVSLAALRQEVLAKYDLPLPGDPTE